ncbi:MAG: STN domain-containing protein, partial [Bacteroidota bacterium]|nr:STN domain-containing protein [Bacteroidota bacterium]
MRLFLYHKLLCVVLTPLLSCFLIIVDAQSSDRITLSLNNVSIQKVISAIEAQTVYRFIYTSEQLQEAKPVTISLTNELLQTALKQCFQNQPVYYS